MKKKIDWNLTRDSNLTRATIKLVCMYVCKYVCMYVCMYVVDNALVYKDAFIYLCISVYTPVYKDMHKYQKKSCARWTHITPALWFGHSVLFPIYIHVFSGVDKKGHKRRKGIIINTSLLDFFQSPLLLLLLLLYLLN